MVALRTPRHSPSDPSVVVVRALPPSYSTIVTSPTDPAAVPMLPKGDTQGHTPASRQKDIKGPKTKKRDLMVRVSRVAMRDCIPDIETDSDEEDEDEERAIRSRLNQNRPKDLVSRNKN